MSDRLAVVYREFLPPEVSQELDVWATRLNTWFDAVTRNDIGLVAAFASQTAPNGWLVCDGASVSRSVYARLFAVVGTTFGPGDDSTTFNVPDLRGRFVMGKAAAGTGSTFAGTFGAIDHVHTGPAHTHTADHSHTIAAASGIQFGSGATAGTTATDSASVTTSSGGTGDTGTGNPPAMALVWAIKYA